MAFHRHRLCLVDHVDLIFSLIVQLVGRFWVFFLSNSAPGFQLWFYFHLYLWVVHWGLLLRLHWRTWVCPCEGQLWRWCSCLGCRGSGTQGTQGAWQLGQQEIQCSRRVWQPVLANTLQYAVAAKSLQSCLTLCDPMDGSPTGSPVPGILQARTLEWVAISFSQYISIKY